MPTQTAYAVYSAKEKAKSSVSDFKRGMVQEQQSRQTGRLEKQTQHRQNIADKRMELQKAQEARQAQRKADGSATTGATRPHERPATASTIPKPSMEKTQEVKRPATATTSKTSEPVKTTFELLTLVKYTGYCFVSSLPVLAFMGLNLLLIIPGVLIANTPLWLVYPYCYSGYVVSDALHTVTTTGTGSTISLFPFIPCAVIISALALYVSIKCFGRKEMR